MTMAPIRKLNLTIHGAENSIGAALIKAAAVETAKIKDAAVETAKIKDAAIIADKLAIDSVETAKIKDLAINNAKIATNADIAWSKMTANAEIRGTLDVDLAAQFDSNVTIGVNKISLGSNGNLGVTGTSQLDGTVTIGASKITLDSENGDATFGRNVTVTGDLIVQGQTTTLNTESVLVEDKLMQVGYVAGNSAPAASGFSGMSVFNGSNASGVANDNQASVVWDAAAKAGAGEWKFVAMSADGLTAGALQDVQMADLLADDIDAATLDLTTSLSVGNGAAKLAVNSSGDLAINTDKFKVTASSGLTEVAGDLKVGGTNFVVTALDGATAIAGDLTIGAAKFFVDSGSGDTIIGGTLDVTGKITSDVTGTDIAIQSASFSLKADGSLVAAEGAIMEIGDVNLYRSAADTLKTDDNLVVGKTLAVTESTTLSGNLTIGADKLKVNATSGLVELAGDLKVGGTKFVVTATSGNLNVNSGMFTIDGATGETNIANALKIATTKFVVAASGDLNINEGKFTVEASSGNTLVFGTLTVKENASLEKVLNLGGDLNVNTDKFVVTAASGNLVSKGNITLKDSSDATVFSVAAASGNLETQGDIVVKDGATTQFSVDSSNGNTVVGGALTVAGNLNVNGTVTYIDSVNTQISDALIHLNQSADPDAAVLPTGPAGICINRGKDGANERDHAAMVWVEDAVTPADSAFKVGMLDAANHTSLTLAKLHASKFYGNGENLTALKASNTTITAITNLNVVGDPTTAASTVQQALASLQDQLSNVGGTLLANVIEDLGFNSEDGTMPAFVTPNYIGSETTLKAAVEKLDDELKTVADNLQFHIDDSTDVHAASAIKVDPGVNGKANVQLALEDHETRIDNLEAKGWRQAVALVGAGGLTEIAKVGSYNIPKGANTQVFIDGRKVMEAGNGGAFDTLGQYTVEADGSKITLDSLEEGQTVELLYWA